MKGYFSMRRPHASRLLSRCCQWVDDGNFRVSVDTKELAGTRNAVKLVVPLLQTHSAWAGWPQLIATRDIVGGEEVFWDYSS